MFNFPGVPALAGIAPVVVQEQDAPAAGHAQPASQLQADPESTCSNSGTWSSDPNSVHGAAATCRARVHDDNLNHLGHHGHHGHPPAHALQHDYELGVDNDNDNDNASTVAAVASSSYSHPPSHASSSDPVDWVDGTAPNVVVYGNHPCMPPLPLPSSSASASAASAASASASSASHTTPSSSTPTITSPPSRRTSLRRPHLALKHSLLPGATPQQLPPVDLVPLPPATPPLKQLPLLPPNAASSEATHPPLLPPLAPPLPSPKHRPKPLPKLATTQSGPPPNGPNGSTVSPIVPMFMELAIPDADADPDQDAVASDHEQDPNDTPTQLAWVTSPLAPDYPALVSSRSPLPPSTPSPARAPHAFAPIDPLSPTLALPLASSPGGPLPVPAHPPSHPTATSPVAPVVLPDCIRDPAPLPTQAIYDYVDRTCTWLHATLHPAMQLATRTASTGAPATDPAPPPRVMPFAAVTGRSTPSPGHPRANLAALVALVVRAAAAYVWTSGVVDAAVAAISGVAAPPPLADPEVRQVLAWYTAAQVADAAPAPPPALMDAVEAHVAGATTAIREVLVRFLPASGLPDAREVALRLLLAHVVWRCGPAEGPLAIHVPRPGDAFDVRWHDAGLSLDDGARGIVVVTSFPGLVWRPALDAAAGDGAVRPVYRAKVWCDPA